MSKFARISSLFVALVSFATHPAFAADRPPLPAGTQAPDFTVQATNGNPLHLSDYRGKIVVLNFWASWCPYCQKDMPQLQDLYNQYKSDIVVLGVCTWDYPDTAADYIAAHPYTFTLAYDINCDPKAETSAIADAYQVGGIPDTYVIDPRGVVVAGGPNAYYEKDIITAIRRLGAKTVTEHSSEGLGELVPMKDPDTPSN